MRLFNLLFIILLWVQWSSQQPLVQATQIASFSSVNDTIEARFGISVAFDGTWIAVGAPDAMTKRGAVYIFRQSLGNWSLHTRLSPSDLQTYEYFGESLSLSGTTLLIGAYQDTINGAANRGSAYIYVRNSSNIWTLQAKIVSSDGAADDGFGYSVAVDGDIAVIGSPYSDVSGNADRGAAYVFIRNGTNWRQEAKLIAADGAADDNFGWSVSLSINTAIVGAYAHTVSGKPQQGSAYVYVRTLNQNVGTWSLQASLVSSDGVEYDYFGDAVSISGDSAVIGAYGQDSNGRADSGAAYVFVRSGSVWSQQQKLTAFDGSSTDDFGSSVFISGNTVVAGAPKDDFSSTSDQGSAYVFTRSGSLWTLQSKLNSSDGTSGDWFGTSLAVSGNLVLVGAPRHLPTKKRTVYRGAAYLFTVPTLTQTTSQRTTAERTTSERTTAERTTAERTTAVRTTSERTTSERTTAQQTTAVLSTGFQTTREQTTREQTTREQTTREQTTREQTTGVQTTAIQTTYERTTNERTTSEKTTAVQMTTCYSPPSTNGGGQQNDLTTDGSPEPCDCHCPNCGVIVVIVLVILFALCALCGLLGFLFWKKKKEKTEDQQVLLQQMQTDQHQEPGQRQQVQLDE